MSRASVQSDQRLRLENLLQITPDGRTSVLDQLRTGPVRVSGPALVKAIQRLETVRNLGIKLPDAGVPPSLVDQRTCHGVLDNQLIQKAGDQRE